MPAQFEHFTSQNVTEVLAFVNRQTPNRNQIQAGLSRGRDFHVWAAKGAHGQTYSILYRDTTGNWEQDISSLLELGAILIGFNEGNPVGMWYFLPDRR